MKAPIDTKQIAERSARMREADKTATMEGFLRVMEWTEDGITWTKTDGNLSFHLSHAYEAQLELNHDELCGYVEHLLSERKMLLDMVAIGHSNFPFLRGREEV